MVVCILYVSILTPYQLVMDSLDRATPVATALKAFGVLCELAFIMDVWFSWHVKESTASMELYEQNLRATYKKERLVWDVVAAIPFYRFLSDFSVTPWVRLLRCVKVVNVVSYLDELNRRSVIYEITRFWYISVLYLLVIYWVGCAYLAVSMEMGFGDDWGGWLPSKELEILNPEDASPETFVLRFLRGIFFATNTFVKKARNIAPRAAPLYAFHTASAFTGFITMSFVLGELASLFISYIGLEVDFHKNHIAIEMYLARLHVSDRLKARAHAFMTSLWSSHAGVNYEEILGEMPRPIRSACVLHISKEPVDWFIKKVISPMCWEGPDELDLFRHTLAEKLHFEGFPTDEAIVVEGSIARAMFFVLRGHLRLHSRSLLALTRPIGLRRGDFFGERGLLGSAISPFTVKSVRACDLLSLGSEDLVEVMDSHKFSHVGLRICDCAYKLLKAKSLIACSKPEMEEHWGTVLYEVVNDLRDRHKQSAKSRSVGSTTLRNVIASMTHTEMQLDGPVSSLESVKEGGEDLKKPPHTGVSGDIAADELPKHADRMFEGLATDKACYSAFSPLLQIIMPSDPLDWSASFRHLGAAANAHRRGSAENEVASVSLEKGAWLSKRHLEAMAKANAQSIQESTPNRDSADTGGSTETKLQQDQSHEHGPPPLEVSSPSSTLKGQPSFASRLRSVDAATGRPVERLAPSADTVEAVAFSMQDGNAKTQNALAFEAASGRSAPPVHVLRKCNSGTKLEICRGL